jgi:hypothetical protein
MFSINHPDGAVKTDRDPSQKLGTSPGNIATDVAPSTGLDGIPIKIGERVSGFFMPKTKTYYRRIVGSKHLLKKPLAITNDVEALVRAESMGADRVRIVDSESGIEYSAPIQLIHEYGVRLNRGYGDQLALPIAYWVQTDRHGNVTPASLPKAAPVATVEAQPSLFDFAETKRGAY